MWVQHCYWFSTLPVGRYSCEMINCEVQEDIETFKKIWIHNAETCGEHNEQEDTTGSELLMLASRWDLLPEAFCISTLIVT